MCVVQMAYEQHIVNVWRYTNNTFAKSNELNTREKAYTTDLARMNITLIYKEGNNPLSSQSYR